MSNSAASFIDQINAEYREVVKAESGALPHAIRCGEFLTLAKENLKAEKGGKWSEWLETNCPGWPAPGSEDTELGVFMGPEVSHGETKVYAGVQA